MRFYALDTLRFIFAFYILTAHATGWIGFLKSGNLVVDFFFVLSGFVLSHALISSGATYGQFALQRFARLWPLHIATMLVVLWIFRKQPIDGWVVAINTLLLQDSGALDTLTLNGPSWSISAEFIIGLSVFFVTVRLRSLVVAALMVAVSGWLMIESGLDIGHHVAQYHHITMGLLRCTFGSCLGYLAYECHLLSRDWRLDSRYLNVAQGSLIVAFAVLMSRHLSHFEMVATIWLSSLMILSLSRESAMTQLLSAPAFRWSGPLSYGVYMCHIPVLIYFTSHGLIAPNTIVQAAFESGNGQAFYTPLAEYYAVILASALVAHNFIEIPGKRMIVNFFASRLGQFDRPTAEVVPATLPAKL